MVRHVSSPASTRAALRALLLLAGASLCAPAVAPFAPSAWAQASERAPARAVPPQWAIDRLDARIAQLKADLRLTEEQNRHWDAFRKALHDVAAVRAPRASAQEGSQAEDRPQDRTSQARGPETTQATPPQPAPQGRLDRTAPPIDDDEALDARDERRMDRRGAQERSPADWRRRDPRARDEDANALADMQDMANALRERAEDLQKVAEAARPLYELLDRRQQRMLIRFIQREWMSGASAMHGGFLGGRGEDYARERR